MPTTRFPTDANRQTDRKIEIMKVFFSKSGVVSPHWEFLDPPLWWDDKWSYVFQILTRPCRLNRPSTRWRQTKRGLLRSNVTSLTQRKTLITSPSLPSPPITPSRKSLMTTTTPRVSIHPNSQPVSTRVPDISIEVHICGRGNTIGCRISILKYDPWFFWIVLKGNRYLTMVRLKLIVCHGVFPDLNWFYKPQTRSKNLPKIVNKVIKKSKTTSHHTELAFLKWNFLETSEKVLSKLIHAIINFMMHWSQLTYIYVFQMYLLATMLA